MSGPNNNIFHQYELHEELNALLWQYSVAHNAEPEYVASGDSIRYIIVCRNGIYGHEYYVNIYSCNYPLVPYFDTEQIANDAIEKVVKPFIARHPEFVW